MRDAGNKISAPLRRSGSEWARRITAARYGQLALFGFSFLEASILPIPVEAVMAPYMQIRRDLIWRLAALALAGFMLSALLGYGLGALFYDEVGAPLIDWFGWRDSFERVQATLEEGGFWAMLLIALTPLPTQVATIGAGALGVPLPVFLAATLTARSLRYFGLGALVHVFGDRIVARVIRHTHAPEDHLPRPDEDHQPPP